MTLSVLIIAALLVSIGLGYSFKINIGLFALSFAYIIGAFAMGLSIKQIVDMWPMSLFLIIVFITFFYGFAINNGTLEKITDYTIHYTRKFPYVLPFAIYALCIVMSGIGAGPWAVFAFMSPPIMILAAQTGMSRVLAAVIITSGGVTGAFMKTSVGGIVCRSLLERLGYTPDIANAYANGIFFNLFLAETLVVAVLYVISKGYAIKAPVTKMPEPFNRKQVITAVLIVVSFTAIMLPSIVDTLIPGNALISFLKKQSDPTFISLIAAVLALLLKLGDEKAALARVPWSLALLVCGVGVLIDVAVKAGAIHQMALLISGAVSPEMAPLAVGVVAMIMCFFSSTIGVVMPTLYPIIPNLAETLSVNPILLFSIIVVCASITGISPFSTGGALVLTGMDDERERTGLFYKLLAMPFFGVAIAMALAFAGVFSLAF
ncbi:MAG: SLC13 family permease [Rhodopila sp.]|nr:SLC13 family permease [Rhodopila sp.]